MKANTIKKFISAVMAVIMIFTMSATPLTMAAYAEEEITATDNYDDSNSVDSSNNQILLLEGSSDDEGSSSNSDDSTSAPAPVCTYCGGDHELKDCTVKCVEHGIEHNDALCPRHLNCDLCGQNGHEEPDCPDQCPVHKTSHLASACPDNNISCDLCYEKGHTKENCPDRCPVHSTQHLASNCPDNFKTNDDIYITSYQVVDANGTALAKVTPGDKVIVAVSVIDERIKAEKFGVPAGNSTGRIHITMAQGAFSVPSSAVIDVKMRAPVAVKNADNQQYQAICYTVYFRDVTYLGGNPEFGFGISYTGKDGTNTNDNMPLPYPRTSLSMQVTQATDDIPAPTIILNNASYGKVAIIGEAFSLVTTATNTSANLDLENVSLKIVLPNGITLANGNSQVLIGKVAKGGTINHTFTLKAEGVANDITSLPVQLVYTFEAFVGGKRTQFTSQQDISINVQQPTRFEIQNMFNDGQMFMGHESYMSASLVNKGKTTVYNVTAELVSDTLTAYDVEFLGNIMPGSTANAEFDFTASQMGVSNGKLLVTYEDASGTQYTLERDFTIEVIEEPVWNEPVIDMPVMEPEQPSMPVMPIVIGVAAIATGGFMFWKKKQKVKRLAELEDEDEDI